jgi:hypothetical protein
MPAKRFVPSARRERTTASEGNPEFIALQLLPLFVDVKTPPQVPAKRFGPLTARQLMCKFDNPELTTAQLLPSFVERNMPLLSVPAKRLDPLTARAEMGPPEGPLVCTH